ncbi:MAG: zinc ribbon domain-containing protein [Eggerthellaceae bacterium]|nr:zinc ribbon domain-containing protein [Eggerthellaceae bacterium]
MGILDDAGGLINRGVASAGRGTRSISLKAQVSDLNKRRETLASQLGAALYEETRNDPQFRTPYEGLYVSIETLDQQKEALLLELKNLEIQAQLANAPQQAAGGPAWIVCPTCGKQLSVEDAFCSGCGMGMAAIKQQMRLCGNCGLALDSSDLFCVGCGQPVPPVAQVAEAVEAAPAVEQAAAVVVEEAPVEQAPVVVVGQCANCGFVNAPDAAFCQNCGNRLQ